MDLLKARIQSELKISCYNPSNTETVFIPSTHFVKAEASNTFIYSSLTPDFKFLNYPSPMEITSSSSFQVHDERVNEGIITMVKGEKVKIIHQDEFLTMLKTEKNEVKFAYCFALRLCSLKTILPENLHFLRGLYMKISNEINEVIQDFQEFLQVNSFRVSVCMNDDCMHRTMIDDSTKNSESVYFCCNWSIADKDLAWRVVSF